MKKQIYYFVISLSLFTSVQAQTIQLVDGCELKLQLESNGTISAVELNGAELPYGSMGGFYSRDPLNATKVPLTGTVSTISAGIFQLKMTNSLNCSLTAVITEGVGYIEVEGELKDLTGTDRGLWLGFNLPVNVSGWKWGQTLSNSPVITADKPAYSDSNNLIPLPAVWTDKGGIAMCIPPTDPCVFEVGADAEGIRIQMAFGLSSSTTKFPSKAAFCFRIYTINGTWGFRDALAKYYDWYPEYYQIDPKVMQSLGNYHDWINMNFIGETFKTNRQINPNIKEYMAYTKTSARIQDIKNANTLKTNEQLKSAIENATTIQHYEKKGDSKSPLIIEGRAALLNSIAYTPDGSIGVFKASEGGIDFPHNCDPDLFKDKKFPVYADMYLRKAEELRKIGNFVSIHWDRLGGWSNFLNYRKEHFAYINHPLTFDQEGRVCIHTQFTNYELFDAYREKIKTGGLFNEAAGMKQYSWKKIENKPAGQNNGGQFFLASVVAGGWQEGSFNTLELGGFDFERMIIGRKSYRISSGNIVAHKESPTLEVIKNALAKTTAYGFACPVQVQYFYPPGHPGYLKDYSWYTKPDHKALWDRYEPANLAIRLAGWEPVTYATSNSPAVQLQRFGKGKTMYLTVWGPHTPDSVELEIDAIALGLIQKPSFTEIVSNTPMEISKSEKGWKLLVPMEKDMTRVIKISQ